MKDEGMQTFQWSLKNSPLIMDLEEGSACSASPTSHYSYYFIPAFYFFNISLFICSILLHLYLFNASPNTHSANHTCTHVREAHRKTKKSAVAILLWEIIIIHFFKIHYGFTIAVFQKQIHRPHKDQYMIVFMMYSVL